jgi:hypothetical protein
LLAIGRGRKDSLPQEDRVRGKTLVIALLAAVLVAFGGIVLLAFTGGSSHVPRAAPGVGFSTDRREASVPSEPAAIDGGPAAPDASR